MLQFLLGVLSTVGLGCFGWIALEFIGRPVRNFLDLRREIRHETLRLANVSVPQKPRLVEAFEGSDFLSGSAWPEVEQYNRAMQPVRDAQQILRALGVRAIAFGETEWAAAKVVKLFGVDPIEAGDSLVGLSNAYAEYGEERAAHRQNLAKALRFPSW